jgi:hypothetical protein
MPKSTKTAEAAATPEPTPARSRSDLVTTAQELGIIGLSKMNMAQLAEAIAAKSAQPEPVEVEADPEPKPVEWSADGFGESSQANDDQPMPGPSDEDVAAAVAALKDELESPAVQEAIAAPVPDAPKAKTNRRNAERAKVANDAKAKAEAAREAEVADKHGVIDPAPEAAPEPTPPAKTRKTVAKTAKAVVNPETVDAAPEADAAPQPTTDEIAKMAPYDRVTQAKAEWLALKEAKKSGQPEPPTPVLSWMQADYASRTSPSGKTTRPRPSAEATDNGDGTTTTTTTRTPRAPRAPGGAKGPCTFEGGCTEGPDGKPHAVHARGLCPVHYRLARKAS